MFFNNHFKQTDQDSNSGWKSRSSLPSISTSVPFDVPARFRPPQTSPTARTTASSQTPSTKTRSKNRLQSESPALPSAIPRPSRGSTRSHPTAECNHRSFRSPADSFLPAPRSSQSNAPPRSLRWLDAPNQSRAPATHQPPKKSRHEPKKRAFFWQWRRDSAIRWDLPRQSSAGQSSRSTPCSDRRVSRGKPSAWTPRSSTAARNCPSSSSKSACFPAMRGRFACHWCRWWGSRVRTYVRVSPFPHSVSM